MGSADYSAASNEVGLSKRSFPTLLVLDGYSDKVEESCGFQKNHTIVMGSGCS